MIVGILQFELAVHDAESLKDKRRVVRSLKDRLHREHLVSVAEIGALDDMSRAMLGVALVGHDGKRIGAVLDSICAKLRDLPDAELVGMARELLRGEGGSIGGESDEDEVGREADGADWRARGESALEPGEEDR